jgi:hypothetical protein
LHLPYVTDEDNAQYMCVAVNNGGRAVSKAELYVAERGISFKFICFKFIYFK